MNKFFYIFLTLMVGGPIYAAVGFFSQSIDFDYQLVEENIYYHNGYLSNELTDSTISNNHSEYGFNYLVKFKSGYHHRYFAILFEYALTIEKLKRYNHIDNNIEDLNQTIKSHLINPMVFFQWQPFRVGIGYNRQINNESIPNKQLVSLRPQDALSLYFHIHFQELWYRAPIGLGAYYEIAFNPQYLPTEIPNHLFHSASLGFHINFNYLSQFQIVFTYQRLDEKRTLYKVENDSVYYAIPKNYLVRYYFDYTFTHQIFKEFALKIGIGNLVYSDFESPILNLNFGITYSFFRI